MANRRPLRGPQIVQVLQHRTLRDIISKKTAFKIVCECSHRKVWSPEEAYAEEKFVKFLDRDTRDLVNAMRCTNCGRQDFFLTISI